MADVIAPFTPGTIEGVAKSIAELYSGSELTRITAEVLLRSDPGEGHTKWRRLAQALSTHQYKTQTGNALILLVKSSMRPDRTLDRKARADMTRNELNQFLSLSGLKVLPDGQIARAKVARTDSEALDRSIHLKNLLVQRSAHPDVISSCREGLLRTDYYEVVFEAIKGLGSRIRELAGIDADGYNLIEQSLGGKEPILKINSGQTRTERDEQLGIANLAKGLFSAFRNPASHEPKLHWTMSELDALDVLGTLSLIHRRLDLIAKS